MARISVPYTVPVQVVIDTDTGRVRKVVVIDEDLTHNPDGYWENQDDYGAQVSADDKANAVLAVEADDLWPAWQFGW